MKLIIGGYAQGRLAYVFRTYHLKESDVWNAEGTEPYQGQKIIYHAEALALSWIAEKYLALWKDCIVITQETGSGLIPITPEERHWREAVGQMNQQLAAYAESVERICCGLSMYLKQEHSHVDSDQ